MITEKEATTVEEAQLNDETGSFVEAKRMSFAGTKLIASPRSECHHLKL